MSNWIAGACGLLALVFWLLLSGLGFTVPHWVPFAGGDHVTLVNGAWKAEANAKRAEKKAEDDRDGWKKATDDFQGGLNTCNASVLGWKTAGDKATAEATANLAKLNAAQASLDAARKRLAAVPKSTDVCPSVDAVFTGAFQ